MACQMSSTNATAHKTSPKIPYVERNLSNSCIVGTKIVQAERKPKKNRAQTRCVPEKGAGRFDGFSLSTPPQEGQEDSYGESQAGLMIGRGYLLDYCLRQAKG